MEEEGLSRDGNSCVIASNAPFFKRTFDFFLKIWFVKLIGCLSIWCAIQTQITAKRNKDVAIESSFFRSSFYRNHRRSHSIGFDAITAVIFTLIEVGHKRAGVRGGVE